MSYRTFKHLIGETSLERKCRFLFGAGLLGLITASFTWYASKTEQMVLEHNRDTCRMLVNPIVLLHHWTKLETDEEFVPTIEAMYRELLADEVRGYKSRFILPLAANDPSRRPENEFEYEALHAFQSGKAEERARILPDQSAFQYLAAIRLRQDCRACHPTLTSQAGGQTVFLKPGDLMAALSITVPLDRTWKAINRNRIILIGTALVTAVLAMIVFYVIVRYVIAKPVKHLKDVSDAVAAGNMNVRADIQTRDEFEELSHAFNRMLRNLIAMQEELRGVNRALDRKVDELARANMALFEMNRMKNDFLATMSHELRTPLNSIIGFSEVLLSSPNLTEKQKRYVSNILSAGRMLLRMITDSLDLAKIESGKMEVRAEEFSIRDVIEGLVNMTRPMAEQKNIRVRTAVDPAVPVVRQDLGKLQQILRNLLSNAVKFTPEGGRVTVTATCQGDTLIVSVSDTGVGIPPEDRERIFEKFRQGRNVVQGGDGALTREYGGSGLGLSIVRELCRLLGGDVSLESEVGRGSTFTVRLPLRLSDEYIRTIAESAPAADLAKAARLDAAAVAAAGTRN